MTSDSPTSSIEASDNRAEAPFRVEVTFPETVTIRMVDASALGDYEFSLLIAGLCCNAAVGFIVAAMTVPAEAVTLWIVSLVFTILTIAFVIWAVVKRGTLKRKERVLRIRGGRGQVSVNDD